MKLERSEVSTIYTRNPQGKRRYTPPPGYDGNTFAGSGARQPEIKAEYDMDSERMRARYPTEIHENSELTQNIGQSIEPTDSDEAKRPAPLRHIINELHGKISSEDMIIILVMLLISCDGITPETVMLALALLAS